MPKQNVANFNDYVIRTSVHIPRTGLTDDDSLPVKELHRFACDTKAQCTILAEKAKNRKDVLRQRKFDRERKKHPVPSVDTSEDAPDYITKSREYCQKWYHSFTEERLKELFDRYYVEGYETFYLAITPENGEGIPLYKFLLPQYLIQGSLEAFTKKQANIGVDGYFEGLTVELRGYGNNCMNMGRFLAFIRKMRKIAEAYEVNKTIKYNEQKQLSQLCEDLPKDRDMTSDILQPIFDSLVEDLLQNKVILQCQLCGDFCKYYRNKKFCSLKSESKDCGRSARNARDYQAHKPERQAKATEYQRKYRALMKKLGVKK